ncbi:uncharacterized protein LOC130625393 isoform X2 [Hydractinia symbiolongicarpus]|uniref:uncharacterized protein LOC130625393 isoform X2 n=1 Tax=Hydractinia symbiolongicarpus TaxID=13093 RepID=UPI00254A2452|nr:uncharacterized protein LOC130625393 isoform X2 [Hydractinia symbiolongicarpus]
MFSFKQEVLFFFDDEVSFPYFTKRGRKPKESLPTNLQEVRSVEVEDKLNTFLNKQKRKPLINNLNLVFLKKKQGGKTNLHEDAAKQQGVKKKSKKAKKIAKVFLEHFIDSEDEDDGKFLFEETKFSATHILSQLGKLLDIINCKVKEVLLLEKKVETPKANLKFQQNNSNLIWDFNNNLQIPKKRTDSTVFIDINLPENIIYLVKLEYRDLIKHTVYTSRAWQTQAYKDIVENPPNPQIKNIDSGVFSIPPTAMSGVYIKSDSEDEKIEKLRKNKVKLELSHSVLNNKLSKESGMTSDSDGPAIIAYRRETMSPLHNVPRPKTRFETYYSAEKDSDIKKISIVKEHKEKEDKIEDVPIPPLNQQMISFAVSSRVCHEKGWVVQPSVFNDPEHQTLLVWARGRLQQAMKQKEQEELEAAQSLKTLTECSCRYYGDTKYEIQIRYKQGTAQAKRLREQKQQEEKVPFMMTLSDGTITILYPSGKTAVISSASARGNYTFVYDGSEKSRLLAHFTPIGRGVCYHKNGQILFISMSKFGFCHDEIGAVVNKWKWSIAKSIPRLSFQLNSFITFRCNSKSSMHLVVNINGEHAKIQLGPSSNDVAEPNLSEMGMLATLEKFSSQAAIQLSALSKKKELGKKQTKKEKVRNFTSDIQEERTHEFEVRFPNAKKEIEFVSSHQSELKGLQRKFKNTVFNWMEHYRVATGVSSPYKTRKIQRDLTQSAMLLPAKASQELWKQPRSRVPSAPTTLSEMSRSPSPFKCGILQQSSKTKPVLPKEGCPLALRSELLGEGQTQCKCNKRRIAELTDVEFDLFLKKTPKTQLLVISIVNSGSCNSPVDATIDSLHCEINKNRTIPCVQARYDAYRLFRYIIPSVVTESCIPLLVSRHNVVPGMFMIFQGGKLLFVDYIFDGYGNTRKNFLRQISRSRADATKGRFLPADFRFNPIRGQVFVNKLTQNTCAGEVARPSITINDGEFKQSLSPSSQSGFVSPESSNDTVRSKIATGTKKSSLNHETVAVKNSYNKIISS